MHRRQFTTLLAVAPAVVRAQPRHPNLIFLLGDDHRWDALGAAGNTIIRTPQLDRLASQGVMFTNSFVTTAICVSSRASFFTGLYSRCHGIWKFADEFPAEKLSRSYPMLLRQSGYYTGFIGKWGIDGGKPPSSQFDYWRGFQGQGRYFPHDDGKTHLTSIMGDQMIEFLRAAAREKPFCLSVSFKAPHVQDDDPKQFLYDPRDEALYKSVEIPPPETADPRYIQQLPISVQRSEARKRWAVRFATPALYQESVKGYYRLISGIDREVGRLRDELERLGQAENTVIIYTGDHGFYLGEHGLAGKWFMHEESLRTPLIIHNPRAAAASRGRRVSAMALNIDIAPTLLNFAGLSPPASMQGRSLLPLLHANPAWRSEFFYEHLFPHAWIPRTEGIRTERWKYTSYIDEKPPVEELYDLSEDPKETHNLVREGGHKSQLDDLRGRRRAWLQQLSQWKADEEWHDPA